MDRMEERSGGRAVPLCVLESFLGCITVFGDQVGLRSIGISRREAESTRLKGEPPPWLQDVVSSLRDFLEGREVSRDMVERLLSSPRLTAFQRRVLRVVAGIPRGETLTYGEVAAKSGNPRAARAVGVALRSNPFPLLFPCHRVVLKGGGLGGYGPGADIKKKLLVWEGAASLSGRRKPGV